METAVKMTPHDLDNSSYFYNISYHVTLAYAYQTSGRLKII